VSENPNFPQETPVIPASARGSSAARLRGIRVFIAWTRDAGSPLKAGMTAALFLLFMAGDVRAAQVPLESEHLQKCLKRADELPDIAAAEAGAWIKNNGGDEAHVCRAFAQANRGMHEDAAREFWGLASHMKKTNPAKAVTMHALAGQEFVRAKKPVDAEAQYNAALKITPQNPDLYIDRAKARMAMEKYWDALDDLNRAIKMKPDDAEALRQRGRAWAQLGNGKNAQEDFEHAEALSPAPAEGNDK
jgi:tetratricopeptide (TPR) repeat protein